MDNYRFERLSANNLKDLIYLYKCSFNEITSLDFLQKKYATGKFGLDFVGFIAYSDSGQPAAYYGVFPIKVQFHGKHLLAAQSGDTMTHPDHQGKGLFIKLAKMTYDIAKNSGVDFIFGFPNKNSYAGFIRKLDWKHYANVNNYKIKTGALPLEKIAKKFKVFGAIYQSTFLNKLKKLNSEEIFENSLSGQIEEYGNIIHDRNFFQYKTYYSSSIVNLNGVKCCIKVDGRLWVGDIEFCKKEKFNETLNSLVKLAKKLSCSSVQLSVFENSLYDKWLKEKREPFSQNPVGCLNLTMNYDPEKFAYQALDFDTF